MTAWVKLSATSFLIAIPGVLLLLMYLKRPQAAAWDGKLGSIIAGKAFLAVSILALTLLYVFSVREAVTFDEFSYAMGLRDSGLFCGPNHFLSHYIGSLAYSLARPFTRETLKLLEGFNIFYGILMALLVRSCVKKATGDLAVANLSALLLGLSYGIWKFATSGEVYTPLLMLWVASVLQAIRINQGKDSWGQFFILSCLSNLAVLAHDMGTLMSVGFLATFLIASGENRWKYAGRYATTGLLLLPFFQLFTMAVCGIGSLQAYINHHLYYYLHPDTHPGDYKFTVVKNTFLVFREGVYSMFSGIESEWVKFSVRDRALTIASHAGLAIALCSLYVLSLRSFFIMRKNDERVLFPLVLAAANWLTIYSFCIFFRPNDEAHHWMLPFTVLTVGFAAGYARTKLHWPTVIPLCLAIAFSALTAGGVYSASSNKLLTMDRRIEWLNKIENSENVVFSRSESAGTVLGYYRPNVKITGDVKELAAAVKAGKQVFIDTITPDYMNYFATPPHRVEQWKENPAYYRVY